MSSVYKKITIFFNGHKTESLNWSRRLRELLAAKQLEVREVSCDGHDDNADWRDTELAFVIGGDGTVLHAARDLASTGAHMLGINTGNLGFLSGCEARDIEELLEAVLSGGFVPHKRMMLKAQVLKNGAPCYPPQCAFNDCVVKAVEPRALAVESCYNGRVLKKYLGDGLVVSSPTGSTAYALAASGPIVYPSMNVFVLAPICPHTLTQRPLVLPGDGVISVRPVMGHGEYSRNPILSVDGQLNFRLSEDDVIEITRYEHDATILLPPDYDYFQLLSKKLHWGQR